MTVLTTVLDDPDPPVVLFETVPIPPLSAGQQIITSLQWNNLLDILRGTSIDKIDAISIEGGLIGPATTTNNAIVRFDGFANELLVDSSLVVLDDTGNLLGAASIRFIENLLPPSITEPYIQELTLNTLRVHGNSQVDIATSGTTRVSFANTIITLSDPYDMIVGTTTGTKIGTATNQKLGLWNATPVIQPAGTGETVGFVAGAGTSVLDDSTFTGNIGTTAYRISDVVKALKQIGALAA